MRIIILILLISSCSVVKTNNKTQITMDVLKNGDTLVTTKDTLYIIKKHETIHN